MSTNNPPKLWKVPEAAEHYRVTERTIRNWIDKGAVDVVRKGRTVRVVAEGKSTGTSTNAA
jgi:excisionase family DNA binding protein